MAYEVFLKKLHRPCIGIEPIKYGE